MLLLGDKKGKFGFAHQKDFEIKNAILKARKLAMNNIFELEERMITVPYKLKAKFNSVFFNLLPAALNSGIRAGNLLYTALDFFGFRDVTVESLKKNRSQVNRLEALLVALAPFRKKAFVSTEEENEDEKENEQQQVSDELVVKQEEVISLPKDNVVKGKEEVTGK